MVTILAVYTCNGSEHPKAHILMARGKDAATITRLNLRTLSAMTTTTFTREEKQRVFTLARELGMSATALYRELNTAPVTRDRETIREVVEADNIRVTRAAYREIAREVTDRCKTELTAARNRREYKLSARILAALSDRAMIVTSGTGKTVTVDAVVNRRGELEAVATVEVVRAGIYRLRLTGTDVQQVTEAELIEALFTALPARVDLMPARYADKLRPKPARTVTDKTGEAATPGSVMGDERDSIAAPSHHVSMQGIPAGVDESHLRESNRLRVQRFRAKQRAARIAADGRTHALKRADVPTVGMGALEPAKPLPTVPDTEDKTAVLAELATLRAAREAWKAAEDKRTAAVPVPAVSVPAPVTVPPVPADTEPGTLF